MQVKTDKISNLALNSVEIQAAEMIVRGDRVDAVYLLDDQLEHDPSRATVAAMLAKSAGEFYYQSIFENIASYHARGFSDAYVLGQPVGKIESKKRIQEADKRLHRPPPYKAAIQDVSGSSNKKID